MVPCLLRTRRVIVNTLVRAWVIALAMAKPKCLGISVITCLPIFVIAVAIPTAPEHTPIIYPTVRITRARNAPINERSPTRSTILLKAENARTWRPKVAIFMRLTVAISIRIEHTSTVRPTFRGACIIMMTV